MPFCRECGKEVQAEWVTCPFCSSKLLPTDNVSPPEEFEKEVRAVKQALPDASKEAIVEEFIRCRDEFLIPPKDAVSVVIERFQLQAGMEVNPQSSIPNAKPGSKKLTLEETRTALGKCGKCHSQIVGKSRICKGCGNAKVCNKCTWKKRLPWFIPLFLLWPVIWMIFFITERCEPCAEEKKAADRAAWWPYLTKSVPLFVVFMVWAYLKSLQAVT